jgi:hypothetical protein
MNRATSEGYSPFLPTPISGQAGSPQLLLNTCLREHDETLPIRLASFPRRTLSAP